MTLTSASRSSASCCSSSSSLSAIRFRVTGNAAHNRLSPLVPADWVNASPYYNNKKKNHQASEEEEEELEERDENTAVQVPDFLWENAPSCETRSYRNHVRCYSHLPNGTDILDSKWVLARLFSHNQEFCSSSSASPFLETHCFRGISGFVTLAERVLGLLGNDDDDIHGGGGGDCSSTTTHSDCFYDLINSLPSQPPPPRPNLWVIKDAGSNGAGGVWVVGSNNAKQFSNPFTSPLVEEHRYVAQQYAWPCVLYQGRKCHVRVYGLITSDGRAFVHQRAFLHVANDPFTVAQQPQEDDDDNNNNHNTNGFEPSVHITNCCANSHDQTLFAGEICASLVETERTSYTTTTNKQKGGTSTSGVVNLSDFAESIYSTVAMLADRTLPFLQGGQANSGFEYLGLDFILSHDGNSNNKPIAYLLEINAPPSQDTATGLSHAEQTHDTVISDIMSLWVLPRLIIGVPEAPGGWRCVYHQDAENGNKTNKQTTVLPSKAAILNKMRWAIYERKAARHDEVSLGSPRQDVVSSVIRSFFPFFLDQKNDKNDNSNSCSSPPPHQQRIFFENAGGAQVPIQVIEGVTSALRNRHRSVLGCQAKEGARSTAFSLLGASRHDFFIYLGSNASTLLSLLARQYYVESGFLKKGDEVIVTYENHMANVTPWLEAARRVGATVQWCQSSCTSGIQKLLNPKKTRIVAVAHASNILGQVRDIRQICQVVRRITNGRAHVIVDGVAVVPHCFADLDDLQADWYAVSCHKVFGPSLGILCGRREIVKKFHDFGDGDLSLSLELGTISYEACAGIEGLGCYFERIARLSSPCTSHPNTTEQHTISESAVVIDPSSVKAAYALITSVEQPLIKLLRSALTRAPKVRIIEDSRRDYVVRLPVFSFVHSDIPSYEIVAVCHKHLIICRNGTFLSCTQFQQEYDVCSQDGVVRISLAHYNTADEIQHLIRVLEAIPGWM